MDPEYVEVSTKAGRLRGLVKKSYFNELPYYSFQGIPYAKPPVGDLRFKAPEPYAQWTSVLDATKEGNSSIQNHWVFPHPIGDEDCLYLNVYTPKKPGGSEAKTAVMVWIHGGGFSKGSGSTETYGPDYLVEEDIVLVTINYRCGALGFLSLENESVPGNWGLKDQLMALRWVQDNIISFGGDPNNVTIFGESAGASSVHYQLLSPLARGLFHKAILQSGTALSQWSLQNKPRQKALLLASVLGCNSQDDEEVLAFLKSVPAIDIVKAQDNESLKTEQEYVYKLGVCFMPCVEVAGKTPFLPDSPRKLMERGEFAKVPVMMGTTDKEGLFALALKEVSFERVNADITVMVPHDLKRPASKEVEKALGREVLEYYTNAHTLAWNIEHIKGYVDFVTDVGFVFTNEKTRQLLLKHMTCPVYSYVFTYTTPRSLFYAIMKKEYPDMADELFNYGSSHADDLAYLFKPSAIKMPFIPPTKDDEIFIKKCLKVWSRFAKTGDPNCKELGVTWPPNTIQNPSYMEMGSSWKLVKSTFSPKTEQFWDKIYNLHSYAY